MCKYPILIIYLLCLFLGASAQKNQGEYEYEQAQICFEHPDTVMRGKMFFSCDSLFKHTIIMVDKTKFPADFVDDTLRDQLYKRMQEKNDISALKGKELHYFPDISGKKLNAIFYNCVYGAVPDCENVREVNNIYWLKGLDPSPQVRRFKCWAGIKGINLTYIYCVELTNPAANEQTGLAEFILNARITLLHKLTVLI